jgi:hypothetical protein
MRNALIVLVLSLGAVSSHAAIIHESATLGPTGQIGGYGIGPQQLAGSRFSLNADTRITGIGGHVSVSRDIVFAAIVELPAPGAFPDDDFLFKSFTQVQSMALFATMLGAPASSSDYLEPVDFLLAAGHYAIIIGGTSGFGGMPSASTSQQPLPGASMFGCNELNLTCFDFGVDTPRFVIEGAVIPIPAAAWLFTSALGLLGWLKHRTA